MQQQNPIMQISSLTASDSTIARSLPKRLDMPPHLQAAKDKSLKAALMAEFNSADIANLVMRVIKGMR